MTGSGKPAVHLFPWVHTLIAKVKGNIRGGYHGLVKTICPATWPNFATVLTDDSGKTRCLNRMLTACLGTQTITFPELRP